MTDEAKASSVLVALTERSDNPAHKSDDDLKNSRSGIESTNRSAVEIHTTEKIHTQCF